MREYFPGLEDPTVWQKASVAGDQINMVNVEGDEPVDLQVTDMADPACTTAMYSGVTPTNGVVTVPQFSDRIRVIAYRNGRTASLPMEFARPRFDGGAL